MGRQRRKNTKKKDRPSPLNRRINNNPSQQRNRLEDNNNCHVIIDTGQLCANCCSIIEPSEKTTHHIPSNSSSSQLECSVNNDDVNKMLSEIYNLDFIPRLQQKYFGAASGETNVVMETEEAEVFNFPLCRICKSLLKCLFSLYNEFSELRKIEGLLSKQINALNTLINYDPGQQQSSHKDQARDEREIFVPQGKTRTAAKTTANALYNNTSSSSSSKFRFPGNGQEPCASVNIGLRLEDRTIDDLGYVPPSICHRIFQEAPQSRKELTSGSDDPEKIASSSDNSKFVFPAHDRGPWVKVGEPTILDKTGEDSASLILRDLYQCQEPPPSNLIISNVVSIQPLHDDDDAQNDNDNDHDHGNDNDMDYEPSLSSHNNDDDLENNNYEMEDLKPFDQPEEIKLDLELDSEPKPEPAKISRELTNKSYTLEFSTPITTTTITTEDHNITTAEPEKSSLYEKNSKPKVKNSQCNGEDHLPSTVDTSQTTGTEKSGKEEIAADDSKTASCATSKERMEEFPTKVDETVVKPRVLNNGREIRKKIKGKVFSSRAEQEIYKKRQLEAPCPCIYCQENFQNPEDRAAHAQEKHFTDRNYLCQTCGAVFKEQDAFNYHQNRSGYYKCSSFYKAKPAPKPRVGEKLKPGATVECRECHKLYKTAGHLKNHVEKFHTGEGRNLKIQKEKKFACTVVINDKGQVCSYRTIAQSFLKAHMLNVHANEKQKVKCSECNREFKTELYLKQHLRKGHTEKSKNVGIPKEKKFACTVVINDEGQVCPYRGRDSTLLKTHMLNVHADERQKVKCSECDREFKTKLYLRHHFYKAHTESGNKSHKSTLEKRYQRLRARTRDIKAKGFVCSHCGKEFADKINHTVHLRSVHNDYSGAEFKILVCHLCGQKFTANGNLNRHMQSVHSDERPCVCDVCGRSYKTPKHLNEHKNTHTDERLFVCEDCGRSYKSQKRLRAHKSVAHNEEGRRKWNAHQAAYKRMLYQKRKARNEAEAANNSSSSNNIVPEMESSNSGAIESEEILISPSSPTSTLMLIPESLS